MFVQLLVIPEAMQTMCVANLEGLTLISTVDRDSLQSHLKSSVYQAFFLVQAAGISSKWLKTQTHLAWHDP